MQRWTFWEVQMSGEEGFSLTVGVEIMEEFQRPWFWESEGTGSILPTMTLVLPLCAILYKVSTQGVWVVWVLVVTFSSIVSHSVPCWEAEWCEAQGADSHPSSVTLLLCDLFKALSLSGRLSVFWHVKKSWTSTQLPVFLWSSLYKELSLELQKS